MDGEPNPNLLTDPVFLIGAYDALATSGQFGATDRLEAMLRRAGVHIKRYQLPIRDRLKVPWLNYPRLLVAGVFGGANFLLALIRSDSQPRAIIAPLGQSYMSFLREGLLTVLGSAISGAPCIYVLHATYFLAWRQDSLKARIFFAILRRCRCVVVLGPRMLSWIESSLSPANQTQIPSMPSVIKIDNLGEVTPLSAQAVSAKHQFNTERTKLLFFSSLFQSKGYWDLLEALTLLSDPQLSKLELAFCGAVQLNPFDSKRISIVATEQKIQAKLNELCERGLSANWHRAANESLRKELFHAAHIFILPSYSEAQPLVIINAMLSGCACVVTPVGEIPSMFERDSATFIEPGATAALAEAISRLTTDSETRLRHALAAHRSAVGRFDERVITRKWIELLLTR